MARSTREFIPNLPLSKRHRRYWM